MGITQTKAELRKSAQSLAGEMASTQRRELSENAVRLLLTQSLWKASSSVLFYAPLADELDIWAALEPALNLGKTIALPAFDPSSGQYVARRIQNPANDLRTGKFGIREPVESCEQIDRKSTR